MRVYVYSNVCAYVSMYLCMYACMYVCMYVCMYAFIYVCMHVFRETPARRCGGLLALYVHDVCVCMSMHAYMHAHVCICILVYVHLCMMYMCAFSCLCHTRMNACHYVVHACFSVSVCAYA